MPFGPRFAPEAVVLCLLWLLLGACGAPFRQPDPFNEMGLRTRAETVAEGGIRVSVAIPDPEESRTIFGIDLTKNGIQPLWLEIENDTDRLLFFMSTGLDPDYFSPREVSFGYHAQFSDDANAQLDDHIKRLAIRNVIDPLSMESGFVFTYRENGSRAVNVDLVGRNWTKSFPLFVSTPGTEAAREHVERLVQMAARPGSEEVDDETRLRELLERLPCCTMGKEGDSGRPLNIVLVGKLKDVVPAFIRRGYRQVAAAPRYLFQRPQDLAAGKRGRWVAAQPHLVRLWLTTIRFRGKPVWIGEVSAPLGGRFARMTDDDAEPHMDPAVDRSRNDLLQDVIYSEYLAMIGFVKGAGQGMPPEPGTTPDGGTYRTDGLRAVLFFAERPVSLSKIQFADWERPADHYRPQVDRGKSKNGANKAHSIDGD